MSKHATILYKCDDIIIHVWLHAIIDEVHVLHATVIRLVTDYTQHCVSFIFVCILKYKYIAHGWLHAAVCSRCVTHNFRYLSGYESPSSDYYKFDHLTQYVEFCKRLATGPLLAKKHRRRGKHLHCLN